jgi:hypothetical protein
MTETNRARLENIARRLEAIRDELNELEDTIGASAIEQAALSTAMAVTWIELFCKTERIDG